MPDERSDLWSPEASRGPEAGTTLEQFRQALTRPVARRNMGIDIGDEDAHSIALDGNLSAIYYREWLAMARADSSSATSGELDDAWKGDLPVRFNRPPRWASPPRAWVLQHLGRNISTYSKPFGAPPADLTDWVWWIPQEPAWAEWIRTRRRHYRRVFFLLGFGILASIGIALVAGGGVAIVAWVCATVACIGLVQMVLEHQHFRMDPVSDFREQHPPARPQSGGGGAQPGLEWDGVGGDADGD